MDRAGLRACAPSLGEFADEGVLVGQRVLPGVLEREGYAFEHTTVQAALAAVLDG